MAGTSVTTLGPPRLGRATYRLRVEGLLDELAFDYVEDLTLALSAAPPARAVTTLTCTLPDQEALVGLIHLLHDFGLPLVSLERLDAQP